MVSTPVLFETFVRVDYARQVWDAIKVAQPKKLYFYSNKGRSEIEGEIEKNNEIRSWVKEIDWDCELHTFFRNECVNVYDSLRGAIDWLFENEESGIILEDDCVPTPAFFSFCDQMLEYYKTDRRVWYVSGDNFFNLNPHGYDYIFTHYHWMYGWATWRDRWLSVDWDHSYIDEMVEQGIYNYFFKTKQQCKEMIAGRLSLKEFVEKTKCWDYYFGIVCDQNNAVGVVPKQHLVTNVGVSGEHNHGKKKSFVNVESTFIETVYNIQKRPPFVFVDYEFDYLDWKKIREQVPFIKRLLRVAKKRIKNIIT